MKPMSILCIAGLIFFGVADAHAADESKRPNVLFIAVDDLNDWVGFLNGHRQAFTPNMDRLAKRGIVFTNAHCASPACNPSRAAIFSGQMPWQTDVWSNESRKLFKQHPDIRVLPHSFRDAGYTTFGTGKLMHSGTDANKRLFDYHFNVEQRWSPFTRKQVIYLQEELPTKGTDQPRHVVDFNRQRIILPLNHMPSDRNPKTTDGESFDWGAIDVPDSSMGDTQITDWAIDQLRLFAERASSSRLDQLDRSQKSTSAKRPPFFMGVGFYRPHIPLYAPRKYFARFQDQPVELPQYQQDDLRDLSETASQWAIEAVTAGLHSTVVKHKQWEEAVKAYLACTTFVDAQIGRLLDALDGDRFGENTIIVLWSDHGWHLGEKDHWGKWTGWERSTRVPLIIVPPKRLAINFALPGSRCDSPVSLIDLYPTLIELCDLKGPIGLAGKSLVPLLRHPGRKSRRAVITSFDPGNISVRNDRWRLIRYADRTMELYDLENDPHEWKNLADDLLYKGQMKELIRAIPSKALPKQDQ